jgi:hypothetical protein
VPLCVHSRHVQWRCKEQQHHRAAAARRKAANTGRAAAPAQPPCPVDGRYWCVFRHLLSLVSQALTEIKLPQPPSSPVWLVRNHTCAYTTYTNLFAFTCRTYAVTTVLDHLITTLHCVLLKATHLWPADCAHPFSTLLHPLSQPWLHAVLGQCAAQVTTAAPAPPGCGCEASSSVLQKFSL